MSKTLPLSAERIMQHTDASALMLELETLLAALEDESSRLAACAELHKLAGLLEKSDSNSELLFVRSLTVPGMQEPIRLFLNAAVFTPELWGKTFAEGLLKDPEYFHGRKLVELGTGSGWVSLLLLNRTGVREILGLDINPIAVTLACLNKFLNGCKADGSLKLSCAGVPVVEALRFEVSDLLQKPLARKEYFDRVIGCIPQVLHPLPEKAEQGSHELSYQDLYDLSNYCFNQGILEDRFGLPLIARALEEAQLCLNPQGSLTLILGGRPGQEAIEEMFRRRAYKPELSWMRRIQQADDTDLVQLVKLEAAFDIKFHFFASPNSTQSVPAATAVKLKDNQQKIYHDLLVYKAETQYEKPTLAFLRNLHSLGLDHLRRELDLSRVSEEQMSFLERLSEELLNAKTIPYPHESGDLRFREKLAAFLSFYCHYQIQPEQLFVGPERKQLLAMILKMIARAGDAVLLSSSLQGLYGTVLRQQELELVLGNNDLSELLQLDKVFAPKICILAPGQLKEPSPLLIDTLIEHANKHPERLYLIDDSDHFEIGSQLQSNLLLHLLGQKKLPRNLVFIYGLVKNTVCPDFELSFLINSPDDWVSGLEYCAELSYSRISYIIELYYEWLFDELLSFPFVEEYEAQAAENGSSKTEVKFTEDFSKVSSDPVFQPKPLSLETDNLIRLDYGEFEYPVPDLLVKGLLKGFLENRADSLAATMQERICTYVQRTRHVCISPEQVVLGQGVFPLIAALVQCLKERLGRAPRVALPRGSYGPIFPLLSYWGAETCLIETSASNAFLLEADQLAAVKPQPDLLYLSQPANPSGIFSEAESLRQILKLCAERGIYLFSDEIFFLLSDSALGSWTPAELSFAYGASESERKYLFYADGLAKSFAAGGLRGGFMVCPDANWAAQMRNYSAVAPQAVLRSWDRLYSAFMEESPTQLIDNRAELAELHSYLLSARLQLSEQRQKLLALLGKHGLSDGLKYARRGGLFILAKLAGQEKELAGSKQLLVNPDSWARSPGWCRLCFSILPDKFDEAMERLELFLEEKY